MTATLERPAASAPPGATPAPRPVASSEQSGDGQPPVTPLNALATAALTAVTCATAVTLCRVFPGWGFLAKLLVLSIGTHAVLFGLRVLRRGSVVLAAGGIAATFVLVAMLYYRSLPTKGTWDLVWADISGMWEQFPSAVAPVSDVGGFATAIALVMGIVATLSDIFAFRAYGRSEALVPTFLVFAVGSSLGYDRNRLAVTLLWIAAAAVCVAMLRSAHAEGVRPWLVMSSRGGAARPVPASGWRRAATIGGGLIPVVGLGVPIAALVASHAPGSHEEAIITTNNSRDNSITVVSPFVRIRSRLSANQNVELFTVETDRPSYMRLNVATRFDGKSWNPIDTYGDPDDLPGAEAAVEPFTQTVRIGLLGEQYFPSAYQPVSIGFPGASFDVLYSDLTGTLLREDRNLSEGLTMEIVSDARNLTPELLDAAPPATEFAEYTELPDDVPADLLALAKSITEDATTPYQQALALQNYFQDGFDYDQNYQADQSMNGIESFLKARRGFCQQFSGTYGVLARLLKLPTRIATGTTWGDKDANGIYHVKGKHAHAWPEVYFTGVGWVAFEPTPGRGVPGGEGYTGREPAQTGGVDDGRSDKPKPGAPGPSGAPRPTAPQVSRPPSSRPNVAPTIPRGENVNPKDSAGRKATGDQGVSPALLAILAALAAAGAWAFGMPALARRRGELRPSDPRAAITQQWRRSIDSLSLVGIEPAAEETPHEFAERVAQRFGGIAGVMKSLAMAVTLSGFSPEAPATPDIERAATARRDVQRFVRDRLSRADRVKARLIPSHAIAVGD